MNFRIGFGYDIHPFISNRPLWLGGVLIPYSQGLDGHSDADVLVHAICDALLGSANLRDIGYHFPSIQAEYKDISSLRLLERVNNLLLAKGYYVGNIDATVCAEFPKINPYIPQMQEMLANTLRVDVEQISIKATTNEKLGAIGRGEGIAAFAVALVYYTSSVGF
ncbi:MAG: 2-C-methyl-D-erythritol 2,4-cyclodiphosphate synthase [Bacteroidia bacterium]|nr:2-C-methyl-D-erythritol 2,4-cyclodiphosphate synthase [Bacteroidia bacterium]